MRRTSAAIGAVAVAGLVMAGCGSSGSDGASSTTTQASVPMTDEALAAVLLTPEDLGAGWTLDTSSSDGGSAPSCLREVPDSGPHAVAQADGEYVNGDAVFARESIGTQASVADAEASWKVVTDALDGCSDVSSTSKGQPVTGTITSNGTADVGDGSKSYTMAFTIQGAPLTIDVVVAHAGQVDMLVMYGAVGAPAPGAAHDMAVQALEKIQGDMTT